MCQFYKIMNELFKATFVLIFIGGVLGFIVGFLYVVYAMIFDDSFFTNSAYGGFFIVIYILICIISIVTGIKAASEEEH